MPGSCQHCHRKGEQNSSKHVQAITVDFLADDWTTEDCRQEQMTDEDIGLILTAKEEGHHPDWQVIYHCSEGLLGTVGIAYLREQIAAKGLEKLQMDETWSCS